MTVKRRVPTPIRHRKTIDWLMIRLNHNNIRKLIKLYNEYCKGKIHDDIMHELTYIKRMWKHPNSRNFYNRKTVGKYLCIMMNWITFNEKSTRINRNKSRVIKHITEEDMFYLRYLFKNIDKNYSVNLPF